MSSPIPITPVSFGDQKIQITQSTLGLVAPFILILSGIISVSLVSKIKNQNTTSKCMTNSDKSAGLYTCVLMNILVITYLSYLVYHMYKTGNKNYVMLSLMGICLAIVLFATITFMVAMSKINPEASGDCASDSLVSVAKLASLSTIFSGSLIMLLSMLMLKYSM